MSITGNDVIALIDAEMRAALTDHRARLSAGRQPATGDDVVEPLYQMMAYPLGWVDAAFHPLAADGGKKLRGQLCVLVCVMMGATIEQALPVAAAIELTHNFTLVHDDIQDGSELRRHRSTVWHVWGVGQAINVGDGLHVLARLTLLRLLERGVAAELVVELAGRCDQTLLRLLEGQYLDMSFEAGWTATEALYERMIDGKSASLVRYCFEAGALLAGATPADVETLGRCGRALGLGFQVRDDILGIWGTPQVTGKPLAGDIRTRKKSLPLLIAMERATEAERAVVHAAYAQPDVDEAAVDRVLAVLDRTQARSITQRRVEAYHAEALAALEAIGRRNEAAGIIRDLIASMVARAF